MRLAHLGPRPNGHIFSRGLLLVGLIASIGRAGALRVPEDFPTIQAALNGARGGDSVMVSDGVWTGPANRNLDFWGKAITLQSVHGPDACIIDCQGAGRGFHFHRGETNASVVRGFTIRNARGLFGGAILIESCSPTIAECVLTANRSDSGGSAISMNGPGRPIVTQCVIAHNAGVGAAVTAVQCSPLISQSMVTDNEAIGFFPGGISFGACTGAEIRSCVIANNFSLGISARGVGGVALVAGGQVTMAQSTIFGNTAYSDTGLLTGGVFVDEVTQAVISGCIIWGHEAADLVGGTVSYSCIEDGAAGTGNISADPKFTSFDDFHLQPDSPCIDGGDPGHIFDGGEKDFDGQSRVFLARVDMGADEFRPSLTGDFDDDLDVDLDDYRVFSWCAELSGPGRPAPFGDCAAMLDGDNDGDVDLHDFAFLQAAFVSDCAVRVDAGTLRPASASSGGYVSAPSALNGSVSQCGYDSEDFVVRWSVQSRPAGSGRVTVLGPPGLQGRSSIAAPAVAGDYVFRLTARNIFSSKTGTDTVTLRLSEP